MKLLSDFSKRRHDRATSTASSKREAEYTEIAKIEKIDGIEVTSVRVSSGPKPIHFEEQEVISPDGKRKLRVCQWSKGRYASTYVTILFETCSGCIYGTDGLHPDVKAFWKDNHTIIIETKKDYEAGTRCSEVRSFDDVIAIEYIEH
jgi:hypothetical protein